MNTMRSEVLYEAIKRTIILLWLVSTIFVNRHAFGQTNALPAVFGPHQWTATVKVVGEDGKPMAGANVAAYYDVPRPAGSSQPTFAEVKGVSDDNGMFIASHTDSSWNLGVGAEKTGYYTTHIGYEFYFDDKRRHPSFTLMLKKIGKPIAMYAKSVNLGLPIFNKAVGFDLEVGDWVTPFGKGVTTDFLFTVTNSTIIISFPNNGDGIQEFNAPALIQNATMGQSDLRSSQDAPTNGYLPQYEQTHMPDPNRNYYFRVRTVLDSKGNILSTHYGKIYGDFMQFTYYLNPTPNDRNIEFAPKHNLLGGIQSFEEVTAP